MHKLFQHNILKNTFYTFSGKMLAMVFYTALDIACARMLRSEDYAEWVFFFAVLTMMFYIGRFGINTSAKVFVSKKSIQNEIAKTIRASFLLRFLTSIAISSILTAISFPLVRNLGYPDKYPNLYHLCSFVGLLIFFNSFGDFFKELFMGLGAFKKLCMLTILEFAGYFFYSILFLVFLNKAAAVATGYVCSGITVFLFGIFYLRHTITPRLFPLWTDHSLPIMKAVLKYAIPIAISSVGGMILVEMDTCMLGILSVKSQVTNYGIAKNLCGKATHINFALTVGSMTSFSVITSENAKNKCTQLSKISILNIFISAIVSCLFLLCGETAITVLYGGIYKAAGQILRCLIPYYILYTISNFFGSFLDFQGKSRIRSICYSSVVVLNLILNFIFIPRLGAVGAAFATSLSLLPYTVLVIIITIHLFKKLR